MEIEKQKKWCQFTSFIFLISAFALHYLIPRGVGGGKLWLALLGDMALLAAVLVHSYMLWGFLRTLTYTIIIIAVSYFAEFWGVKAGVLFGPYEYNYAANPWIIFGVPFYIPLLYVYLAYSGHFVLIGIKNMLLKKPSALLIFSIMAGALLMVRDLATDPITSTVYHVWIWTKGGGYYGVPIQNFIGWFCVFAISTFLAVGISWHIGGASQRVNLHPKIFYLPISVFLTLVFWGFTSSVTAIQLNEVIGKMGVLISVFILFPIILFSYYCVWMRHIRLKKET